MIFFKSESDRQLWIKLNAEIIIYTSLVNNNIKLELGDINDLDSVIRISMNQLEYDEAIEDKPRFSLEELLTLSEVELYRLDHERTYPSVHTYSFKIT